MVNTIAKELGYEGNVKQEDFIDGTIKEKEEWMKTALRLKFENPEFKKLLLETGTKNCTNPLGRIQTRFGLITLKRRKEEIFLDNVWKSYVPSSSLIYTVKGELRKKRSQTHFSPEQKD